MATFATEGDAARSPTAGRRPPADRPRVLLTEGSSCTARSVLYALAPDYRVDILDPSAYCQARMTRLAERWIRSPHYATDPAAYLEFLAERLATENYDVVFPTHEEVLVIARDQQRLGRLAGLAVPSFAAVDCLISKVNFSRLLTELDIPQPETAIVSSAFELAGPWKYPVYVKSAIGTAGSGVRFICNDAELHQYIADLESSGRLEDNLGFVVQQPAVGTHGSISVVFQHGRLVGWHSCAARRLGVGGAPMAHVSTHHPVVVDYVRRIGEHLCWHGAAFFDFFHDAKNDNVAFIEGNPRIWQTANGVASGVNLSKLLVQVSLGETVAPLPAGKTGVRTHEAYLILMTRALEGASRRQLVGEMIRCWRRTGLYADSEDELTRLADDWLSFIPYTAIAAQLLANPRLVKKIVAETVERYSLSSQAFASIRQGATTDRPPIVSATR